MFLGIHLHLVVPQQAMSGLCSSGHMWSRMATNMAQHKMVSFLTLLRGLLLFVCLFCNFTVEFSSMNCIDDDPGS